MTSLKALTDILNDWKNWITRNPSKAKTLETRIFFIADLLLGRFKKSNVAAEWLKSVYRLVSLLNGLIIIHSRTKKPYSNSERLNIFVAALEHCEIGIEKSAEQLWGKEGKLNIIKYVQTIKFLAKLTLVLHFQEKIIGHPCEELEVRSSQLSMQNQEYIDSQTRSNNVFRLKTSGRIMRTVASAPPLCNRLWKPPVMDILNSPTPRSAEYEEKIVQAMGELLYIIKPIVNLALIRKFGARSWKQWTFSLIMDLLSLNLIQFPSRRRHSEAQLTPVEKSIIAQRRFSLVYYFIRSPFFLSRVANPIYFILYFIPIIGPFLSDEVRFYLSSYFFLWSK